MQGKLLKRNVMLILLLMPFAVWAAPEDSARLKPAPHQGLQLDTVIDLDNCIQMKSAYYSYIAAATHIDEDVKCPASHPVLRTWWKDLNGFIQAPFGYAGEQAGVYCCAVKQEWVKSHTPSAK